MDATKKITIKYGKRSTSFVLNGKTVMSIPCEDGQSITNEVRHWETSGYQIIEKGL